MNNIRIKDIAKAAGVSPATVSCCLTGTRNVKPETKQKIMEVIEQMRYIPNSFARNLRCKTFTRIGIIFTGMDEAFYSNVLMGISSVLSSHNFALQVAFSNNSPEVECTIIDDFISQNISGLILVTCQPENTGFFKNRLLHYQIPTVFLNRQPLDYPANYIGYDNFEVVSFFMKHLLAKNYQNIALFCGPTQFTSETNCVQAYRDALTHSRKILQEYIFPTNASKEDAFKKALTALFNHNIQAILCSTNTIAVGVTAAASFLKTTLPTQKMAFFVISEENWCLPSQGHHIIYSSQSAYKMGIQAATLLTKLINTEACEQTETILLRDSILNQSSPFSLAQAPPLTSVMLSHPVSTLHIMLTDLNSANSIVILSKQFEQQENIKIEYTFIKQPDVLKTIVKDNELSHPKFDLYMYDIPWLHYLVQNQLIADITEYIKTSPFQETNFFTHNLQNCRIDNHYYGIPIVGGAQIMFYRKDLFESNVLQKKYKALYNFSLKPPKTWKQFLQVARFFTRKYNPDSPTEYGTSLAGKDSLTLAPELFTRILSFGGCIWDSHCRIALDSLQNQQAFQIIKETLCYCEDSPFKTSIAKTIQDFCCGKTAMLITYIEWATEITNALTANMIGSVDYATVPGFTPVTIGWNLGVSPYTENFPIIKKYLNWLGKKDVNNYFTILDGQTTHIEPYHNPEFNRLYPWMKYTEDSFKYSQQRIPLYKKNALIIPQNEIDDLLYSILQDMELNNYSIKKSLANAHSKGKELLTKYGYYITPKL